MPVLLAGVCTCFAFCLNVKTSGIVVLLATSARDDDAAEAGVNAANIEPTKQKYYSSLNETNSEHSDQQIEKHTHADHPRIPKAIPSNSTK
jgi:hypothetical protein